MSHTKMKLFFLVLLAVCFCVSCFSYKCKECFYSKKIYRGNKLWINKLNILLRYLQSCTFNCRTCSLVMMLKRESTAWFSHHRINFQFLVVRKKISLWFRNSANAKYMQLRKNKYGNPQGHIPQVLITFQH